MLFILRSLIRESLLTEEVYGAQATVYHGTKADPQKLVQAILNDEFRPGEGAGSMYGNGLYTVYDPEGAKTMTGGYGDHVIKLKVNLYGYIIFDHDIAVKVYKKPLTPAQQAEKFGYSDDAIKALGNVSLPHKGTFTSESALSASRSLQHYVKGLVFTGSNDGRVVVVYDPTTAVPMAWKRVSQNMKPVSEPWTTVDKAKLLAPLNRPDISDREGRPLQQSALRRSAMGNFEAGKWELSTILKRLERLPKDLRVVKGNLSLGGTSVASLPSDLKMVGNLDLRGSSITSLPAGLQVGGNLILNGSVVSLPVDLQVGGDLDLNNAPIAFLPAGLQVGGNLDLYGTSITSFPSDARVSGGLTLWKTPITSLPQGLKVGGYLILWKTPITSLPQGLKVGGRLDIRDSRITSLPDDLEADLIYGLDRKYWNNVPNHLKGKLR